MNSFHLTSCINFELEAEVKRDRRNLLTKFEFYILSANGITQTGSYCLGVNFKMAAKNIIVKPSFSLVEHIFVQFLLNKIF